MFYMEIWKTIDGFKNYEVSNLGNVKSKYFNKEKILKFRVTKFGYIRVMLQENGVKKECLVHRLVAKAFIKNNNLTLEVNHKDLDKSNNRVENLEWVTKSQNINHSYLNGRNKKNKKVIREDGKIYNSIVEASLDNNVTTTAINNCLNNKSKKSNGYVFKYYKE